MARTFSAIVPPGGEAFYHQPSNRWYRVLRRDGKPYLRRWQLDSKDAESNVLEQSIDYTIGSGAHAQTFLHRTPDGRLFELPLSWYSANGGFWAMSPGYDRPDHSDFRRQVSDPCLFCHSSAMHSIDCQRCHAATARHFANPKGQIDVCLQCHLQTTSRALPDSIPAPGRTGFSSRLHFDHAPGTGYDEKFEVNGAAYRLMKSKCFTSGKLLCATCHDPHNLRKVDVAAACRTCHASPHTAADCVSCHMRRRRTEDAIHVVLTDHKIQRRPPADPLAPLRESTAIYRGPVVPFYPKSVDPASLAIAQVKDASNLEEGIRQLAAIPGHPLELANAYLQAGRYREAAAQFRKAGAVGKQGEMLLRMGQVKEAIALLERDQRSPESLNSWSEPPRSAPRRLFCG